MEAIDSDIFCLDPSGQLAGVRDLTHLALAVRSIPAKRIKNAWVHRFTIFVLPIRHPRSLGRPTYSGDSVADVAIRTLEMERSGNYLELNCELVIQKYVETEKSCK